MMGLIIDIQRGIDKMKKLIILLLAFVMCFALVACGGGSDNTETPSGGEKKGGELWINILLSTQMILECVGHII